MSHQGSRRGERSGAPGKAAVGFISGLVGLLVGNLILGPTAIALGVMALRDPAPARGRTRATLAIALGAADLLVFAVLVAHHTTSQPGGSWSFTGF